MSKKRKIGIAAVNILFVAVFVCVLFVTTRLRNEVSINLYLGESHAGQRNTAQLYHSDDPDNWKKNNELTVLFDDDVISYPVGDIDFSKNIIRIDPFNVKEKFSIVRMELTYRNHTVISMTGAEMDQLVEKADKIKTSIKGEVLVCKSKNRNPKLIMKQEFSRKINHYNILVGVVPCVSLIILYAIWGCLEVYLLRGTKKNDQEIADRRRFSKLWQIIGNVCATLALALGVVVVYALNYFEIHFGQVPFGQLIYHLHTPLEGTDISSYKGAIWLGAGLGIGAAALFQFICWLFRRKKIQIGFVVWCGVLGVLLTGYTGVKAFFHFDLTGYYKYTHESTSLYEDEYVDGKDVTISFPEKKRNLIYIFLESMEITYADRVYGGGMAENYIPELSKLAIENECFSDGTSLNGAYPVSGATYTMGGLAAQTSGTPINESMVSNDTLNGTWDSDNNYLPGVWSIGDVLAEQGYNQEFLIGSDGKFAGRTSYFHGHGGYDVEDYYSAIENDRIPKNYKVWWGYEDAKLFTFAREDALKLAGQGQPFNLTMLTVDTHFSDGYVCENCREDYPEQYSNVIACSSRQVADFVKWVQEQDFYENTTIVIAGDHLTMDSYYIENTGASGYDRKTYVTIINPASDRSGSGEKRIYTTLDLYPTTIAALGAEIEGDRLGLGVDLFSGKQTLAEKYGLDYLNTELLKNSDYYTKKLLYNK